MMVRTGPLATRPPSRTKGLKHVLDAATPVCGFLVGFGLGGPSAGIIAALAVGAVVAVIRLLRGDSLKVVAVSLGAVLLHSLFVLQSGEGKTFFLPELLLNAVLAVLFTLSLLAGRPVSGLVARMLKREVPEWRTDETRRRLHVRITAMWLALWCAHLVIWLPLYLGDNVYLLGITSVVLGKPAALVCVWVSWRMLRRARDADGGSQDQASVPGASDPERASVPGHAGAPGTATEQEPVRPPA